MSASLPTGFPGFAIWNPIEHKWSAGHWICERWRPTPKIWSTLSGFNSHLRDMLHYDKFGKGFIVDKYKNCIVYKDGQIYEKTIREMYDELIPKYVVKTNKILKKRNSGPIHGDFPYRDYRSVVRNVR